MAVAGPEFKGPGITNKVTGTTLASRTFYRARIPQKSGRSRLFDVLFVVLVGIDQQGLGFSGNNFFGDH